MFLDLYIYIFYFYILYIYKKHLLYCEMLNIYKELFLLKISIITIVNIYWEFVKSGIFKI